MTFEQLDYFLAAADEATFFEAAETLHITQSTLSKHIIKLEKELNLELFDRSARRAVLTPAGKVFYKEAHALSIQYHEMLNHMNRLRENNSHELHIGTLPFLAQYRLTTLIRSFCEQYPDIHVDLDEVEEQELIHGLENHRYDLILARAAMIDSPKYSFLPLAFDRLAVLLPLNHPLAAKHEITLKDIRDEAFLLMPPYTSIYQLCIQLFERENICPEIVRTARMESIMSAVAVGEGISICAMESFNIFTHPELCAITLTESPRLTIGAAWMKTSIKNTAIECFKKFSKSYIKTSKSLWKEDIYE